VVDSGPNVTLMFPYDAGVFYDTRVVQEVDTVLPIQAYLDLIGLKGRGEGAAETLFGQVTQKSWKHDTTTTGI